MCRLFPACLVGFDSVPWRALHSPHYFSSLHSPPTDTHITVADITRKLVWITGRRVNEAIWGVLTKYCSYTSALFYLLEHKVSVTP